VEYVIGALLGLLLGGAAMLAWSRKQLQAERERVDVEVKAARERIQAEADTVKKEAELTARAEMLKAREEQDRRSEARSNELRATARELDKREQSLGDRESAVEKRSRLLDELEGTLTKRQNDVRAREEVLAKGEEEQKETLARMSGMTREQAREELLQRARAEIAEDEEKILAKSIEDVRAKLDERTKDILSTAIQRVASQHASEITVSVVDLPNEEVKGRIIGREGRNIRAFEKVTGVDVIVDDTPGVIVLSAFDGVRRETARRTINKLIKDGRIHPARIEELFKQTQSEMEEDINETGRRTVLDLNIGQLHPKLVHLLGRLKYRTSYGQNVLQHSMEAAELCAAMAGELGMKTRLAKRCGLLHDIGKAVDHEVEGGHPAIGADIARRCGEDNVVVNAIAAHHEDVRMETPYAVLTAAADAISAARPGARRDTLEKYVQRLQKLEEIACRYEGVDHAYAIQAGREIRVMVNPTKIGDRTAQRMAREIAKSIENELTYPGEVKVTLVRETRVTDYAR
jgi:ribonuclease Y